MYIYTYIILLTINYFLNSKYYDFITNETRKFITFEEKNHNTFFSTIENDTCKY